MKAVSEFLQNTSQSLVVWLVMAAQQSLRIFSLEVVWKLGACLGTVVSWCLPRYRRLVAQNLHRALGNRFEEDELRRIGREHFRYLGGNLLSGFRLSTMSAQAVEERVELQGRELLEQAGAQGRGVVMVLAHQSCWELLSQMSSLNTQEIPAAVIYQSLRNQKLDALVRKQRARRGNLLLARNQGFRQAIKQLRAGGIVGVLSDQHAGNAGTWMPFFGRMASTTTLPALLARRTGAQLVPISVRTKSPGQWVVSCGEPIDPKQQLDSGKELTLRLSRWLEQRILEQPADWFWVHRRWKTPTPDFLWTAPKREPQIHALEHETSPLRVLVRSPNWLGDACMALPMVRAIKAGRPKLHLSILCRQNLSAFWEEQDAVDEVIAIEPKASPWQVASQLKRFLPFDAGILCTNSTRTALEMAWGGVFPRYGHLGQFMRRRLISEVPRKPERAELRHQVEHYLDLGRLVGADCARPEFFQPARSPETQASESNLRIGLVCGAEYGSAKRWPLERFVSLIEKLATSHPQAEFLLFGVPAEKPLGAQIESSLDQELVEQRLRNLIGKTNLAEAMAELMTCRLVIANDTGGMHLAASQGVAVVALFGSTEPAKTRPLGRQHRIIRHHVACSPCFLRECPIDFRCMKAIEVEEVVDEVEKLLKKT